MFKRIFFLLFIAFFCLGCQQYSQPKEEYFFKEEDSYQRLVVIPQEPQRIVSFSGSITEIIFLLHQEKKLVAVSDFCTYPPATKDIPKVGKLLNINVESVLKLQPDLVLISSVVGKQDVEKMERAGLTVFAIKGEERLDDIFTSISTIGKILNCSASADSLCQDLRQQLPSRENIEKDQKAPSVYYVVGFGKGGDYTAPGNSYIQDIICLAGGRNIGEPLHTWSVSREYLFQQNPDYIFIREEDLDVFCSTEPYIKLDAVKKKHVYPIPSGWIDIVSPRNINAVNWIKEKIGTKE